MSKRRSSKLITYEELEQAWWSIYDGYADVKNVSFREYRTQVAFEALLKQCGWTVSEWNDALDRLI